MLQRTDSLSSIKIFSGWAAVGLMALIFAMLYLLNFLIPLEYSNYTSRIWDWTELALTAGALVVISVRWQSIRSVPILVGAALGFVSGISYFLNDHSLRGAVTEGVAVWLTFIAGTILFQTLKEHNVPAFQMPFQNIIRGLGLGIVLGIPLAGINNLFFFLQNGAPQYQNILFSMAEALSPGIHEEAVFRYFILAACFTLLQGCARPRLALVAAMIMAVVPHSLLHLPDLFLTNPLMAIGMLVATSLLFGLPMALLQVKRSFETAVAFHWFIDFARFYFGY